MTDPLDPDLIEALPAAAEIRVAVSEPPGVVAYRSTSTGMLRCLDHVPPPAARAADCNPVESDDLPDGGICTYPGCGVDVLIARGTDKP